MSVLSIDVALKGLRENLRDRRGLLFLTALPLLLIIVFSFVFGSGQFLSGGSLPHEVVVVNNDVGIVTAANNTTRYVNYGSNFTKVLENATAENSTTHLFHLNNVSEDKADDLLKSGGIDAVFIIPKNFSLALTTMVNNSTRTAITSSVGQKTIATAGNASSGFGAATPGASVALPKAGNTTATILAHGDGSSLNFFSAEGLAAQILVQYTNGIQENASARAAPGGDSIFESYVSVGSLPVAGTESATAFDGVVPGLIVFSLLLQISVVSSSLVRDNETGMLDRLKLSKIRSFDLLSGTFLTWAVITIAQVLLLVGVAVARGYNYQGGAGALGLAVLIGVIAGMASIALALIVASFARNDTQAMLLGAMIATPLGFMAGAFIPIPRQVLGEFAGRTYTVYEVLPWTWAVSALRSVLTYGSGLSSNVVYDLAWLILLTAILFFIGVAIYSRAKLRTAR